MSVLGNKCAAGMPRFIDLDPETYRPRSIHTNEGIQFAICHYCDQITMVKQAEPRLGFFVEHSESQQTFKPVGSTKSGTPPRVRGRGK